MVKVRPDLTNEELQAMGEREPGSGAAYLQARREELAVKADEDRRERDDADALERFTQAFVKNGGRPGEAAHAWRAEQTSRAAKAASREEAGVSLAAAQRLRDVL